MISRSRSSMTFSAVLAASLPSSRREGNSPPQAAGTACNQPCFHCKFRLTINFSTIILEYLSNFQNIQLVSQYIPEGFIFRWMPARASTAGLRSAFVGAKRVPLARSAPPGVSHNLKRRFGSFHLIAKTSPVFHPNSFMVTCRIKTAPAASH